MSLSYEQNVYSWKLSSTIKVMVLSSTKMSLWQPTIDLLHVERQAPLQFRLVLSCRSQRDALCCSQSQNGKRWWTSWIERHTGVIIQHTGVLWWFNSHVNFLNQCTKRHCFSKKQHTLHTQAHTHKHTGSKQKLHTRNYNLLYLTQLHVSRIIRQRLDNPDRNPFHSLSPLQILILQYHFQSICQQSKAFQGFKIPRLPNLACGGKHFFFLF